MSKAKQILESRRKELSSQLKSKRDLETELKDLDLAIKKLNDAIIKKQLVAERSNIKKTLSKLTPLQKEYDKIVAALYALDNKTCRGCSDGCDECRTGWRYR